MPRPRGRQLAREVAELDRLVQQLIVENRNLRRLRDQMQEEAVLVLGAERLERRLKAARKKQKQLRALRPRLATAKPIATVIEEPQLELEIVGQPEGSYSHPEEEYDFKVGPIDRLREAGRHGVRAAAAILRWPATALLVGLPLMAIGRGWMEMWQERSAMGSTGIFLCSVALGLGALFFLFSVKYYLATLAVMLLSWGGSSTKSQSSVEHGDQQLDRIAHRKNGRKKKPVMIGDLGLGYYPKVCVQIATYNEKRVIGRLLEAIDQFSYPNYEVIVADDSTDDSVEILKKWEQNPKFKILHRSSRSGFKGGALAEALKAMSPDVEYVVIFDSDSLPFPDSIERFIPHFYLNGREGFEKPVLRTEVGAVQSYQWHALNRSENWVTEAVRAEYAGSYMVERPMQEMTAALKMIAGTAYMIRAEVLRELGWGTSITEDWELTLRMYLAGYKVTYTPYAETPAECVSTLARLMRQRMRWAEGHSHNVRKYFWQVMRSKRLSGVEKLEFAYYSIYYLQAAIWLVGSSAWAAAEWILHVHLPFWTAAMGYSLVLTNLFSLPMMNAGGLFLEGAPARDLKGVLGGVVTSFLLIPAQAYAAIKGLVNKNEGPWFRTPKSGHITDQITHLRQLQRFMQSLRRSRARSSKGPRIAPTVALRPAAGRPNRWLVWGVVSLVMAIVFGMALRNVPTAYAASAFYLHSCTAPFTMDGTAPTGGGGCTLSLATVGTTQTWVSASSYPAGTTIAAGSYVFTYYGTGTGNTTATITYVFGYSTSNTCSSPTTLLTTTGTVTTGNPNTTTIGTTSSGTTLPVYGAPNTYYLCFTLTVTAITGSGVTLHWDGGSKATNISWPTVTVDERDLLLLPLALAVPIYLYRRRVRRFQTFG